MLTGKSVLVIDDEPGIRLLLSRALKAAGATVYEAPDGQFGALVLEQAKLDLVITDILMPGKDGVETICDIRLTWPHIKIVAISGGGRLDPAVFLKLAEDLGADLTMNKPLNIKALIEQVSALFPTSAKVA